MMTFTIKTLILKSVLNNYYKDLDKWIIKNNIKTIYLPYVTQGIGKKFIKR